MLGYMRTTLDVPDELLARAKRKAVEDHVTLSQVVEKALRLYVAPGSPRRRRAMKKWTVIKDRRPPGFDIADRDRLYEVMECPVRDRD
jgi:hypothetical protein